MGQKIYNLRTQKGLTLEELGNMVGVGKSTVRKWENGIIANMKRDKILKVSEALGTSPAYLMGWNEEVSPENNSKDKSEQNSLPYNLSHTAPQNLFVSERLPPLTPPAPDQQTESCIPAETDPKADFYIKVKGNSMINARIYDGDVVFIKKQDSVQNGEIAAVLINGEKEAILKRLYHYKDKSLLILRSENSAYEDLIFINEELNNVKVLGKAVAFQSCIR